MKIWDVMDFFLASIYIFLLKFELYFRSGVNMTPEV